MFTTTAQLPCFLSAVVGASPGTPPCQAAGAGVWCALGVTSGGPVSRELWAYQLSCVRSGTAPGTAEEAVPTLDHNLGASALCLPALSSLCLPVPTGPTPPQPVPCVLYLEHCPRLLLAPASLTSFHLAKPLTLPITLPGFVYGDKLVLFLIDSWVYCTSSVLCCEFKSPPSHRVGLNKTQRITGSSELGQKPPNKH